MMRWPVTALVLLLAVASGRASAGSGTVTDVRVRATASGVSVHAREVPRGEVLRALATELSVEVRGHARVDERVTVALDDAPLPEALRGVLGAQSFLVHYGPDARPRTIELLGAGAEVALQPPPEMAEDAEGTPGNAPSMPGSRRRYPIDGRLAGAMGTDAASFDELLGFAVGTTDPSLQRAAVARGLGILEHEPELRAVLLSIAQRSPQLLARYAVAAAGDGADAFVGTVAGVIGDPARTQGDAVRREIRALTSR
ncbi:hypothetical protein K2Z84_13910 [Candidatus Binatia bacterium]|nr:hypothetical protein [Candidatus Binatia bacterium]